MSLRSSHSPVSLPQMPPLAVVAFISFPLEAQRTLDSSILIEVQFAHSSAQVLNAQLDECLHIHSLTHIYSCAIPLRSRQSISCTPEGPLCHFPVNTPR